MSSGRYIEITCPKCNAVRNVKVHYNKSNAGHCRSCAASFGGRVKKPKKITGQNCPCKQCGTIFWQYAFEKETHVFCSHACASLGKRVHSKENRTCKQCQKEFIYSDRPSSNSAGNFCSLDCRNTSYSEVEKYGNGSAHRPRWKSIRNKFIKFNNFCSKCGEREKRLCVHHVLPYRICKKDELWNLVTLCGKCHSSEEKLSLRIAQLPEKYHEICVYIRQAVLNDRWMLYANRD